jgi:uncharacterized membrane protein
MFASKTRSILKTLSWRIVGTLDTMFLGWIITGDPTVGLKIGALELVTKFVLYYLVIKQSSNLYLLLLICL